MAFQIYRIPCTPVGSAGAAEVIVTQTVKPGILRRMSVIYSSQPASTRVYVDQGIGGTQTQRVWALVGGNTSTSFLPVDPARTSGNVSLVNGTDAADGQYQPFGLFGNIKVEVNLGDPVADGVVVFLLVETK